MLPVRRLAAAGAKLEVGPRMTESSDTSDTPAKPQDYAGLRAELAMLELGANKLRTRARRVLAMS
jgi:hypothetical protein